MSQPKIRLCLEAVEVLLLICSDGARIRIRALHTHTHTHTHPHPHTAAHTHVLVNRKPCPTDQNLHPQTYTHTPIASGNGNDTHAHTWCMCVCTYEHTYTHLRPPHHNRQTETCLLATWRQWWWAPESCSWPACATWLIYMCDMTHLYVRHDSFICATCLIFYMASFMCDSPIGAGILHVSVRHDSSTCVTWMLQRGDMAHSCVPTLHSRWWAQESCSWFLHMKWLIQKCNSIPVYVWHDSFICATWLL